MEVSIVVSTFGHQKWQHLAKTRAIPSANQFGIPVIYNHGPSLHEARNAGLNQAKTEYVCHLDADDELDARFFNEISKVEGDLRAPAVVYTRSSSRRYVHPSRGQGGDLARLPKVAGHVHDCVADCLEAGNWLVVGTVARTELLLSIGGWRAYPVYEDFDLWQRCWIAGATIVPVPKAVYIAHTTGQGRNNSYPIKKRRLVHYEISKTNLPNQNWEYLRS